jgi:hypothetical protein
MSARLLLADWVTLPATSFVASNGVSAFDSSQVVFRGISLTPAPHAFAILPAALLLAMSASPSCS